METRNFDSTTAPNNTKMILGVIGAVALALMVWALISSRTPTVDTRDRLDTPITTPTNR